MRIVRILAAAACAAALLATSTSAQTVFTSPLSGSLAVPSTASPATGTALFTYDPVAGTLGYRIEFDGLVGNLFNVQFGIAPVGDTGPVLFPLGGTPPLLTGTTPPLSRETFELLAGGLAYLNVRTSAFPNGEIRGQLTTGADRLYANFDGLKVVPPDFAGHEAMGTFTLVAPDQLAVDVYSDLWNGLLKIHAGQPGENGPELAAIPATDLSTWQATLAVGPAFAELLKAGACYAEIMASTREVVRGQIEPMIARYGTGTMGLNGLSVLDVAGKSGPGGTLHLTVANGQSDAAGLLLVGFLGSDIPLAKGGFLYVTGNDVLPLPVILDGTGSLDLAFDVPMGVPYPLWLQLQFLGADRMAPNGKFTLSNGISVQFTDFPD